MENNLGDSTLLYSVSGAPLVPTEANMVNVIPEEPPFELTQHSEENIENLLPQESAQVSAVPIAASNASASITLVIQALILEIEKRHEIPMLILNSETNISSISSHQRIEHVDSPMGPSPTNAKPSGLYKEYHTIPNPDKEETEEYKLSGIDEKVLHEVDESSNVNEIPYSREYYKLWLERKHLLEKEAERRAKVTAKQWQKDKMNLKQIIDESLKEYIELYERAHALLLQFEYEKSEWMNRVHNFMQTNLQPNGKSLVLLPSFCSNFLH